MATKKGKMRSRILIDNRTRKRLKKGHFIDDRKNDYGGQKNE